MKYFYLLTILLYLFCACNDLEVSSKDDISNQVAKNIVGSWFAESDDAYEEDTFTDTGVTYAKFYFKTNFYNSINTEGEYTTEGNQFKQVSTILGTPSVMSFTIDEISSLLFRVSNDKNGSFIYYRIIGAKTYQVGDVTNLEPIVLLSNFCNDEVSILGFSTIDESIASVNDKGIITAKLQGQTYVKVQTTLGIVVIKITVNDDKNLWNNYAQSLRKSSFDTEQVFGPYYFYKDEYSLIYSSDNYYVREYEFTFGDDKKVEYITLFLRPNSEERDILNYLSDRFDFISENFTKNGEHCFWYVENQENRLFSEYYIYYLPEKKTIIYTLCDVKYLDLTYLLGSSYHNLFQQLGFPTYYSPEKYLEYENENNLISQILFILDNNEIKAYSIQFNKCVTEEMINDYLIQNFAQENDRYNSYIINRKINGEECLVLCEFYPQELKLLYQIYKMQK